MQKMDPQLRKLLEVSYEALMDAGLIISELPPERCGVYVGCCGSEACSSLPQMLISSKSTEQ
jgi:fatty acid synthase